MYSLFKNFIWQLVALETIKKFAEQVNENVRITERTQEFDKLCKKIPRLNSIKSAMIFSSTDMQITFGQNKFSTLILFFDRIIVASDQGKGQKKIEYEYPLDLVWPDSLAELAGSDDTFRLVLPEEQFLVKHSNVSFKKKWIDELHSEIERYCTFRGVIEDNFTVRKFRYKFKNKDHYNGSWESGVPHGEGVLPFFLKNHHTRLIFTIYTRFTFFFFVGIFSYYNQNVYEGNFQNGKRHGQGKMTWTHTGEYYEGGWEKDKPSEHNFSLPIRSLLTFL